MGVGELATPLSSALRWWGWGKDTPLTLPLLVEKLADTAPLPASAFRWLDPALCLGYTAELTLFTGCQKISPRMWAWEICPHPSSVIWLYGQEMPFPHPSPFVACGRAGPEVISSGRRAVSAPNQLSPLESPLPLVCATQRWFWRGRAENLKSGELPFLFSLP